MNYATNSVNSDINRKKLYTSLYAEKTRSINILKYEKKYSNIPLWFNNNSIGHLSVVYQKHGVQYNQIHIRNCINFRSIICYNFSILSIQETSSIHLS